MTKFTLLTLLAAITATSAMAQESRTTVRGDTRGAEVVARADSEPDLSPVQPRRSGIMNLTLLDGPDGNPMAATVEQWSQWADIVCGGDSLIIYDLDENGDPTNVRTSCLDD